MPADSTSILFDLESVRQNSKTRPAGLFNFSRMDSPKTVGRSRIFVQWDGLPSLFLRRVGQCNLVCAVKKAKAKIGVGSKEFKELIVHLGIIIFWIETKWMKS